MTEWTCNCVGPQPGAKVCPCREREEHAAEVYSLNGQINVQADNHKAQALEISRLRTRVEIQQGMLDWRQARIDQLEAELSPQGQAEKAFKT